MDQRHEGGGGSFCCRCCCFRFFFLFSLVSTHCFLGEEEEISVGLTHRGWSSRGRRSGVLRWRWSQSTEPFEKSLTGAAAAGGGGRRAGLEEESGISVPLFFSPFPSKLGSCRSLVVVQRMHNSWGDSRHWMCLRREHLGHYRHQKFALLVRKIEAFSNQYLSPPGSRPNNSFFHFLWQ